MSTYTIPPDEGRMPALTWLAFLLSIVAVAGSLYLSLGMGLDACPLCFYQRAVVMAVCAVLAVGLLTGMGRVGPLSLLTLPLGLARLGISVLHVYQESTGKLEWPIAIQV